MSMRVYGLKNIIFSRSVRNVSLEFHMTHGQRENLEDDEVRRAFGRL